MKARNINLFLLIIILTLLLCSCNDANETEYYPNAEDPVKNNSDSLSESEDTKAKYKKITAEEAKKRMDENDSLIIVDVRSESEYAEKHIAGAILIPNETIIDKMPELLPDPDAEILIYCRSGNRSRQAANKLIDLGYTNIYDFGGIIDWPYETVTE